MTTIVVLGLAVLVLGILYFSLRPVVSAYRKFRGSLLVTCPETGHPAGIEVDARRAAWTAGLGTRELRISECSRWPEKKGCGEECLKQVEASPEDCLVLTILAQWYEGKACVLCGTSLGSINWLEHKPALMSPEGRTLPWDEVRAEALSGVLATHKPVCFQCHNAESFRREHPELVIDRPRKEPVEGKHMGSVS